MLSEILKSIIQLIALIFLGQVAYNALVPRPIKKIVETILKQVKLLFTKVIFPSIGLIVALLHKGYDVVLDSILRNMGEEPIERPSKPSRKPVEKRKPTREVAGRDMAKVVELKRTRG